ncbi:hypothetical protein HDU76_002334 [Blyttiomyces sp. JEL0837]|nr:hypothetical protein HDU76_002334 [Blyttiomyces sp. JEL0837]
MTSNQPLSRRLYHKLKQQITTLKIRLTSPLPSQSHKYRTLHSDNINADHQADPDMIDMIPLMNRGHQLNHDQFDVNGSATSGLRNRNKGKARQGDLNAIGREKFSKHKNRDKAPVLLKSSLHMQVSSMPKLM